VVASAVRSFPHVFDALGAAWWADAGLEPQTSAVMPQWAVNRGNQRIPHARVGLTPQPEFRNGYGLLMSAVDTWASAPHSSDLNLTTFDIRVRMFVEFWDAANRGLVTKRTVGTTPTSYSLQISATAIGCFNGATYAAVPHGLALGNHWVRAVCAGTGTVSFFAAPDSPEEPASWRLLGVAAFTLGPANTAPLTIGAGLAGATNPEWWVGVIRRVIVSPVGGDPVFDADFTTATDMAPTFTDATGKVVTITTSSAAIDSNDPLLLTHTGTNYLYLPRALGNFASTPHTDSLSITGDVELVAHITPDVLTSNMRLITKRTTAALGNYEMFLDVDGTLGYGNTALTFTSSSVPLPYTAQSTFWVKATYRASDHRVQFFHAANQPTEPTVWTQLGTNRTHAVGGNTATTANLCVGAIGSTSNSYGGRVWRAIVRNGIDGTAVFDADFTQNTSHFSFVESTGNTVTINRSATGRKSAVVTRPVWLFGTDDFLEVRDEDAFLDVALPDSFTAVAVVRTFGTTGERTFLAKRSGTNTLDGWQLCQVGSEYRVIVCDGPFYQGLTPYVDGALVTVAGVRDAFARTMTVIRDGVAGVPGRDNAATTSINGWPMRIGAQNPNNAAHLDGELVAVAWFKTALSPAQASQISAFYGNS
jgi:hypothetical protein